MHYRLNLEKRISKSIGKARRAFHIDTQSTRGHLIRELEELFQIASDYACGKVKKIAIENEEERPLTVAERHFYAKIATFAAQTINSLAKGIDERQIDEDLDKLEEMLNKKSATVKVPSSNGDGEPPRKSEGT